MEPFNLLAFQLGRNPTNDEIEAALASQQRITPERNRQQILAISQNGINPQIAKPSRKRVLLPKPPKFKI